MRTTGILIAICLLLAGASCEPVVGQIYNPIPNSAVVTKSIAKKENALKLMDAWVSNNAGIKELTRDSKSFEQKVNSPVNQVLRKHKFVHFKEADAAKYIKGYINRFFIDAEVKPKVADSLVSLFVDDADVCRQGGLAYELAPDIVSDSTSFDVTVRWLAISCSFRNRYEMILYEARRKGTFTNNEDPLNNSISNYIRAWLLDNMNLYFKGESVTC